jgi:hypothetical protein
MFRHVRTFVVARSALGQAGQTSSGSRGTRRRGVEDICTALAKPDLLRRGPWSLSAAAAPGARRAGWLSISNGLLKGIRTPGGLGTPQPGRWHAWVEPCSLRPRQRRAVQLGGQPSHTSHTEWKDGPGFTRPVRTHPGPDLHGPDGCGLSRTAWPPLTSLGVKGSAVHVRSSGA